MGWIQGEIGEVPDETIRSATNLFHRALVNSHLALRRSTAAAVCVDLAKGINWSDVCLLLNTS